MILPEVYITLPKPPPQKSPIEIARSFCIENEPKPLYCELPEDLKFRFTDNSGTTQTYTSTSSMILSGTLTSTTTTL